MSEYMDQIVRTMQNLIDGNDVEWEIDETGCLRLFKPAITKNSVKPTETAHVARVGKVIKIDGVEYHMEKGEAYCDCIKCAARAECPQLGELWTKCCELDPYYRCVKIVNQQLTKGISKMIIDDRRKYNNDVHHYINDDTFNPDDSQYISTVKYSDGMIANYGKPTKAGALALICRTSIFNLAVWPKKFGGKR